jgi:hypothetical protein
MNMNQDQVKEKLISLGLPEKDFEVIFSGKQSKKVNGLYRPDTKEIIIHNRNFQNDNLLMFTAIHEYVHHVVCSRKLVKGRSAHPTIFWALFHSTIKVAIEKGIYSDSFVSDPVLKEVKGRVDSVVKEQLDAQRKLGLVLLEMQNVCQERGARYEDYLDRHAHIPKETAKAAVTAQMELFGIDGTTPQVVELVASIDEEEKTEEAVARVRDGQTIAQIRAAVKQGKEIDPFVVKPEHEEDDEEILDRLMKERKKLNAKIQDLTLDLQSLDATIRGIQERNPHLEFDEEDTESDDGEGDDGQEG